MIIPNQITAFMVNQQIVVFKNLRLPEESLSLSYFLWQTVQNLLFKSGANRQ